jgi:RNA 2',3'-cyclic 3'-phosphodiesterase
LTDARSKRLFFALWPDDEVRQALARISLELPPKLAQRVHPQDMHATLAFLGAVGIHQLPCVLAAGARLRGEPFTLEMGQLGFWPRPRVIWAGLREEAVPPALTHLVAELQDTLTGCGFVAEQRPYAPHLTLARKAAAFVPTALASPIPWTVREFALVESIPHVPPPRYVVLKKWPLGAWNEPPL